MTSGGRAARWSQLHHGADPYSVPLLLPWLRLMWAVGEVLARVPPTIITAAGVVFAVAGVWSASALPWIALALVLLSVLCDGLDGAVAIVADRASSTGAQADAAADRVCDVLFAAVLWRCGAPLWLAVASAVLAVGVDVLRRVVRRPTRITVAERPTFAICAMLACASSAVSSHTWPPSVCAVVWVAATVVALGQVALGQVAR